MDGDVSDLAAAWVLAQPRWAGMGGIGTSAAARLFDGRHHGQNGLLAEAFGPVVLIRHDGEVRARALASLIRATIPGVQVIGRSWAGEGPQALSPSDAPADPGPIVVLEEGARFEVDLARGWNTGLFVDARAVRRWLRAAARGLRILNLFSYTGTLGVAAMLGGARSVTHVDAVPSTHRRAEANHRLSGLAVDPRSFVLDDAFHFMRRAASKGQRWDLVVLDPPPRATPRARGGRGGFDPEADWDRLWVLGRELCATGGRLVVLWAGADGGGPWPHVTEQGGEQIEIDADCEGALRAWVVPTP